MRRAAHRVVRVRHMRASDRADGHLPQNGQEGLGNGPLLPACCHVTPTVSQTTVRYNAHQLERFRLRDDYANVGTDYFGLN